MRTQDTMTSRARPIHQPPREIRREPDETEPSFSYEQESFLPKSEDEVEDEFHRRLTGTNFWRGGGEGPSFNSMNMKQQEERGSSGEADESATPRSVVMVGSPNALLPSSWTSSIAAAEERNFTRKNSSFSSEKKEQSKQRTKARQLKLEAQNSDIDLGHLVDSSESPTEGSLSRNSSADSPSLLYGKTLQTPRNGALLAKGSSSLIFPTGVETTVGTDVSEEVVQKTRRVNLMLDQAETVRFPFKKKLILENMGLIASEVPVKDLQNTSLGNSLYKLSLAGNRLASVPPQLVVCLPTLKHLDLSQCELHQLPEKWNLPLLKRLNLSHNRILEFPDETMLEGLPELQDLNMYGNKVAEIIIPHNTKLLSKLETLNLGYNDLAYLPDELDQLKALRTLKLMRNFLERIPMRVCDMDIKEIDVSSNPLIQPPIETCERGMCSMKRYYHCLRNEEQNKNKALEEVQKKLIRQKKREEKKSIRKFKKFFSSPSVRPKSITEETPEPQSMRLGEEEEVVVEKASREEPVVSELRISELKENKHEKVKVAEQTIASPSRESELAEESIMEATTVRKSSAETASTSASDLDMSSLMLDDEQIKQVKSDDITVNDTLKVIFVGMAMAGKTSMIKRLIEGKGAQIPKRDERTVGVDIYEWDPRDRHDWDSQETIDIDTRIEIEDKALAKACGDVNVKFSVWDFAGQHVYHATHELFFSPRSLYVLVWDMGATNRNTLRKKSLMELDQGAFRLSYDSSDDEDDDDFLVEEEARRADRALERDIDEKVQFWVDCIQSSAPGAAILPVASFDDYFSQGSSQEEAERRCNVMKNRLLKHEERRIAGIKERLQGYVNENRANDEGALRLQQLLCPYTRPKLIFGNDEKNSVVRVSGTKCTGFDRLTEKLVHIATGKERPAGWKYPIFRGHVGAQIPRMRLEVREAVREMRDRFKVVEWGYFLSTLRERGLMSVEDISDALHFLTNIGELSYFGNVFPEKSMMENRPMKDDMKRIDALSPCAQQQMNMQMDEMAVMDDSDSDDMDDDDEHRLLLMDDTVSTLTSTRDDSSLSTTDNLSTAGLSQYVFLNPRWLVAAVACILRHDLDREIRETRRTFERLGGQSPLERGESFSYEANLNCPVITASDAGLLWHAKKFTKKAAERAKEYSNNLEMTPFDFLQRLLIRFGVFVPIDLSIDKALLGGKEHAQSAATQLRGAGAVLPDEEISDSAKFFFLPSLLGPGEPAEAWTYKNSDSWKTTLCHSILFPDGVPPGLMERITAAVLSSIYSVARQDQCFRVKEILCWRTAFFVKLGTEISRDSEEVKESVVEIFAHLADRESHLCVGSDAMGTGMRRLVLSGKGQVGDGGRKIWTGGYLLVIKAIGRVMAEYGGLEYEKQGFCPECLSKKAVSQASSWDWTVIRTAGQNGDESMRCCHGHRVDTRLVAGPCDSLSKPKTRRESIRSQPRFTDSDPIIPVNDLLRGVVLVGLWDGRTRKIVRVGSGFIVDKKRGLIVTASHTLMNIWGDRHTPFGSNYYGLRDGKIVIGVIPGSKESDNEGDETEAVFRYFAKIAAKDPSIEEKGECQADVCVLRITTRMEHDVGGNGEGIGDQPERLLLNNPDALKRENLQKLKVTEKCELDEQVRILGYNQGGEGLLGPGESLNRYVDFARGYVCKKFATGEEPGGYLRHRFKPLQEFVVICPTIGGHSGGPCVNQQGEVLGILSRADPAENQRCYLVPASAWKAMVKKAKNTY